MTARLEGHDVARAKLERDLRVAREKVFTAEANLANRKGDRDRLIVALRRLDPPPSARYVADLAGVSNPWVLKLEKGPG